MSPASNKIALFIDGANLYATAKTLGFDIDYKRLLKEFQSRGTLLRAFYYTAIIEDQEYSSIRPLIDWLDYNGYTVVTKATKEFIDASGRRKVKGNMDIELAVDAMELAEATDPHGDALVLPMRAPGAGEPRITLTLPAILDSRAIYLHIEGERKREVLESARYVAATNRAYPISAVLGNAHAPVRVYWCP